MKVRKCIIVYGLLEFIMASSLHAEYRPLPSASDISTAGSLEDIPAASSIDRSSPGLPSPSSGHSSPTSPKKTKFHWPDEEQPQYTPEIILKAQDVLSDLATFEHDPIDKIFPKVKKNEPLSRLDSRLQAFLREYTKTTLSTFTEEIVIDANTKHTTRVQLIFIALSVCASAPVTTDAEKPSLQFFRHGPLLKLTRCFITLSAEKSCKNIATNCLRLLLEIAAKLHSPGLRLIIFIMYYHLIRLEYDSYAGDFFPAKLDLLHVLSAKPPTTTEHHEPLVQFLNSSQEKDLSRAQAAMRHLWYAVNQSYDDPKDPDGALTRFMSDVTSFFDVSSDVEESVTFAPTTQDLFDKEKFAYVVFALGLFMYCHSSMFIKIRSILEEDSASEQYNPCCSFWTSLINLFFYLQNRLEEKHFEKYHMRLHFSSILLLIYNFDFLSYKTPFVRFEDLGKQQLTFAQLSYMLTILLVRKNIVECKNHDKMFVDTARLVIAAVLTIAMSAIPGLIFAEPLVAGGISALATAASGGRSWDYLKEIHTDLQKESALTIFDIKFETLQYAHSLCKQAKPVSEKTVKELRTATLVFLSRKRRTFFDRTASPEKMQEALMKYLIRSLKKPAKTSGYVSMQETISRIVENPTPDEQAALESESDGAVAPTIDLRGELSRLKQALAVLSSRVRLLESELERQLAPSQKPPKVRRTPSLPESRELLGEPSEELRVVSSSAAP